MSTLSSRPQYCPTFNLWLRLYAHALLRESRIFPGIKLRDESPGFLQHGFADIWKGDYRGKPVCVKVIRLRDPTALMEIGDVRNSCILSEVHSGRFVSDISSCERRGQTSSSSERTPRHRSFRNAISALHHESVDAEWKHRPVHPGELRC